MKRTIYHSFIKQIVPFILFVTLLSSCTTTDHGIQIAAVNSEIPVSASAYILSKSGKILPPEEYEIIQHFDVQIEDKGIVAGITTSSIDISERLEAIVKQHNGEGIVNLVIRGYEHDPGNTGTAGFLRIFGGAMTIGGGLFLAISGGEEPGGPIGGGFLGIGALSAGASFVLPTMSESIWTIKIEGDVIIAK